MTVNWGYQSLYEIRITHFAMAFIDGKHAETAKFCFSIFFGEICLDCHS